MIAADNTDSRKFKGCGSKKVDQEFCYVSIEKPSENIKDRYWRLCDICTKNGFPLEAITWKQVILSKIERPYDTLYSRRVVVRRRYIPCDYYNPELIHEHKQQQPQQQQTRPNHVVVSKAEVAA